MPGQGAADRVRHALGLRVRRGVPAPPRVVVELRGAVPGSVVRIAAALAVVGVVVLSGAPTVVVVLGVAAAGVVLRRPAWPVGPVVVLLVGFSVLGTPDLLGAGGGPGAVRAAVLVLGVHVMLRLTALAGRIAWRGVVDRAVLGAVARSVLAVQLVAQGALLGVLWLRGGFGAAAGQDWLRIVAALALVGVVLLVVPRGWMRERPPRRED